MRNLKKLDRTIAAEILDYMDNRIAAAANPTDFGKPLRHAKIGLWRYRVRDYRIICQIDTHGGEIDVQAIGHRGTIYD